MWEIKPLGVGVKHILLYYLFYCNLVGLSGIPEDDSEGRNM
jgi:hypothetical protein